MLALWLTVVNNAMLQCGRRPRDVKLRETCGELEAAGYFWGSDTEWRGEVGAEWREGPDQRVPGP